MIENSARLISLVPSWTETFIWADLNVVGRTRFCIHPRNRVSDSKAIGGTKGINFNQLKDLKPDFVVFDKEENNKEMFDQLQGAGIKCLVTHVISLQSAVENLFELGQRLSSDKLKELSQRYQKILQQKNQLDRGKFLQQIKIKGDWNNIDLNQVEYVIWKNPYMTIGQKTFIADVFNLMGISLNPAEKYPQISEEELLKKSCLLSSEPYPFQRDFNKMLNEGYKAVLVDGEKISWYGIRNLLFLESCRR